MPAGAPPLCAAAALQLIRMQSTCMLLQGPSQPVSIKLAFAAKAFACLQGGALDMWPACRALAAAAPVHRAHGILAAAQGSAIPTPALDAVARLTSSLVQAGGLSSTQADSWQAQACAILLEAWVELLAEQSFSVRSRWAGPFAQRPSLLPVLAQRAASLAAALPDAPGADCCSLRVQVAACKPRGGGRSRDGVLCCSAGLPGRRCSWGTGR